MIRILLLLSILFSLNINIYAQYSSWKLEKDKASIQIYTRTTDESLIKEFKAITIINSDMNSIIDVLEDADTYLKWMDNCEKSKRLDKINDSIYYNYTELAVPWPLNNRDAVFLYKSRLEKGKYIAELISKPNYIEAKEDIVRLNKAKATWVLFPKSEHETVVRYQFSGDLEVNIPTWILNMFIVDGPYKTLANLKKIIEDN